MLTVAGFLRNQAEFTLFDYLDRAHRFYENRSGFESDPWGRGRFYEQRLNAPFCLKDIPRYWRRYGLPRARFHQFLEGQKHIDTVFIQTVMTYWYPGVREVIDDIRTYLPKAKIILGGPYATICHDHAKGLGADLVIEGKRFDPIWSLLGITGDCNQPAFWQCYRTLTTGAIKISDGCPFQCSYCSVPKVYGKFQKRPLHRAIEELESLVKMGVRQAAFYDDALLFDAQNVLLPFLEKVLKRKIKINFHTPNALNARFITKEIAEMMVRAGFKTFYLGFESTSDQWQKQTGGKVFSEELAAAVNHLSAAGADTTSITAYQILGHPDSDIQQLESSMHVVRSLGIRGMLADFCPIPGTPDGEKCRQWIDLDEPLMQNKTAFTIIRTGFEESNRLKDLQRKFNRTIARE